MSSNIQVERICRYCNGKFIARTTKTKYCSHTCNSRHYKELARQEKLTAANTPFSAMSLLKTTVNFPDLAKKPFLTINETSTLLNVSPVTLRRWIKEGMIPTQRIGKKHIIKRADIDAVLG